MTSIMSVHEKMVKNYLIPLVLRHRGESNALAYLREFERTQYYPLEELRELQLGRLKALLKHAADNCLYYRQQFQEAGFAWSDFQSLDDIRHVPILEKRHIQEFRDEMVADNWPKS